MLKNFDLEFIFDNLCLFVIGFLILFSILSWIFSVIKETFKKAKLYNELKPRIENLDKEEFR